MAGRRLAYSVVVNGEDGNPTTITPEQDVPEWALALIGDHAYADDASDEESQDGPPPQSGKGSAKDAWVAYATRLGVDVDTDATRDDIIAVIESAGHPVEQMAKTAEALADSVTPEGVHAHIPQRPEFTSTSRPSADAVASLGMSTARGVIGAVGGALPDHLFDYAVTVTEVGTAAKVEQSYFPEQQLGQQSPAAMLWQEYSDGLTRLVAQALARSEAGGGRKFGQISLHRRTAALYRAQEIAAVLPVPIGMPGEPTVVAAETVAGEREALQDLSREEFPR